jgi:hypothetical protein
MICSACPHIWKLLQGASDFPLPSSRTWTKLFINHSSEHINLIYNIWMLLTLEGAQFSLSQFFQCQAAIMLISNSNETHYSSTLFYDVITDLLLHTKTIASLTRMLTICGYTKMSD